MHHPFTSPLDADIALMEQEPGRARAKAYDLVFNGSEIGGGSIRIHDQALQKRMFSLLNISPEEAQLRFGFLIPRLQQKSQIQEGLLYYLQEYFERVLYHQLPITYLRAS